LEEFVHPINIWHDKRPKKLDHLVTVLVKYKTVKLFGRVIFKEVCNFDLKEFLMAIDIATCQTEESKLAWAFKLYDLVRSITVLSI